jgi:hypothetical protein
MSSRICQHFDLWSSHYEAYSCKTISLYQHFFHWPHLFEAFRVIKDLSALRSLVSPVWSIPRQNSRSVAKFGSVSISSGEHTEAVRLCLQTLLTPLMCRTKPSTFIWRVQEDWKRRTKQHGGVKRTDDVIPQCDDSRRPWEACQALHRTLTRVP